jgi:hypothetical protein
MGFEEEGKVVLKEEYVLEKFDGDEGDPDRVLRERITLVKEGDMEGPELVSHEFFDEEGKPLEVEGGKNGTN